MEITKQSSTVIGISINNPQYSKVYVEQLIKKYPSATYLCSDGIATHTYRALKLPSHKSFTDFAKKTASLNSSQKVNWNLLRIDPRYRSWIKKLYKLCQINSEFKQDISELSLASLTSLARNHNKESNFEDRQIEIATRFLLEELAYLCWHSEKYGGCEFVYHRSFDIINKLGSGHYGSFHLKLSLKVDKL